MILITDKTGYANIISFASYKSKIVVGSVLGAETYFLLIFLLIVYAEKWTTAFLWLEGSYFYADSLRMSIGRNNQILAHNRETINGWYERH